MRAITEGSLFSGSSFSQLGSWAHGFMAHRLDFPLDIAHNGYTLHNNI